MSINFDAMAGQDEATIREAVKKLTVKELRAIWEKYTPYAEVQRTPGLSKVRKAEWVETVVYIAVTESGKQAHAEEEGYIDCAGDNTHPEQDLPAKPAANEHVQPAVPTDKPSLAPIRTQPTPKSKGRAYRFACKDVGTLRKILNTGSVDTVKVIAESYAEFQPRRDGKAMTKKFYVDAIVRLYFPQEQEKPAPAKPAKPEFQGERFAEGRIYVMRIWNETRLYKVIQRKGNKVTIAEVSPYNLTQYLTAPETKTVKHIGRLTEYLTPGTRHHEDLLASNKYERMFFTMYYTPGCDVDFDEIAYSPDYEVNPAVLDDVPGNEYSEASAVLTVRDGIDAVRRIRTFPEIHEVLRQYSIEEQNLAYHEHMLERAKKRLSAARSEYEVVKAACMNGNKYLARMLGELKQEYRAALVGYKSARSCLRASESRLAANF